MMIMLRIFVVLVLALTVAGCSRPIVATGYLDDYSKFNRIDEKERKFRVLEEQDFSVDMYFPTMAQVDEYVKEGTLPPNAAEDGIDLSRAQPILFIVNEPLWLTKQELKDDRENEIIFVIRERLYRYLLREYPHPVRVRYAFVPTDPLVVGYRVIHVDSAVTHIKKGSGWTRLLIGYGAGATTLQIEGRLREGPDGDVLLGEFALRNDHGGYPHGFLNPRVLYIHYCLKYAAEQILREFTEQMRDHIPAVQPGPPLSEPVEELSDQESLVE